MGFVLSCCSTADLAREHFEKRKIHYICFHYSLDDQEYPDDLGQSMPFDTFYKKMAEGAMTKTAQISTGEYEDYFREFLEAGQDIVHVTVSSGLSGTFNSAQAAAQMLKEEYPERKIYIIDSLGASSGYGLLMDAAADKRDEGLSAEELKDWIERSRLLVHHWFFSTDLKFYVRGGRLSKTAGFFGGVLKICPLLNMDREGYLCVREKIRTKKKVREAIVKRMEEHARDGLEYNGKCYISMSACMEDAREVARLVEERFPHLNGRVLINNIGTTIGAHTGPGTVALFFFGDERGN
jgi:DegV family protein with EDD domain